MIHPQQRSPSTPAGMWRASNNTTSLSHMADTFDTIYCAYTEMWRF